MSSPVVPVRVGVPFRPPLFKSGERFASLSYLRRSRERCAHATCSNNTDNKNCESGTNHVSFCCSCVVLGTLTIGTFPTTSRIPGFSCSCTPYWSFLPACPGPYRRPSWFTRQTTDPKRKPVSTGRVHGSHVDLVTHMAP